eukprot:1147858-Pelagomonas_calceolata.AAC.2
METKQKGRLLSASFQKTIVVPVLSCTPASFTHASTTCTPTWSMFQAAQDLSSSLAYYLSALCLDVPNVPTNPGAQKGLELRNKEKYFLFCACMCVSVCVCRVCDKERGRGQNLETCLVSACLHQCTPPLSPQSTRFVDHAKQIVMMMKDGDGGDGHGEVDDDGDDGKNDDGSGADSADEEEEDDDDMGSSKGLSLSFKRKGKQAARAPKDARSVPPCVKHHSPCCCKISPLLLPLCLVAADI